MRNPLLHALLILLIFAWTARELLRKSDWHLTSTVAPNSETHSILKNQPYLDHSTSQNSSSKLPSEASLQISKPPRSTRLKERKGNICSVEFLRWARHCSSASAASRSRTLLWTTHAGFGNQLIILPQAISLARMLNRCLILDWSYRSIGKFIEPRLFDWAVESSDADEVRLATPLYQKDDPTQFSNEDHLVTWNDEILNATIARGDNKYCVLSSSFGPTNLLREVLTEIQREIPGQKYIAMHSRVGSADSESDRKRFWFCDPKTVLNDTIDLLQNLSVSERQINNLYIATDDRNFAMALKDALSASESPMSVFSSFLSHNLTGEELHIGDQKDASAMYSTLDWWMLSEASMLICGESSYCLTAAKSALFACDQIPKKFEKGCRAADGTENRVIHYVCRK